MDEIRRHFRNLEFHLPIPLQTPIVRVVRDNPYGPVCDATRSIFVHTPKTAGTSIGQAIYGSWVGHVPLSRFAAFDRRKFNSFFKFAFVRNPWDRLLSAFAHLKGYGEPTAATEQRWAEKHLSDTETFEQFVLKLREEKFRALILNDVHFRSQLDWICIPGSNRIGLDYLGRFETIAADFAQIAERLGVSNNLPKLNQTRRPPYRDAYSTEMRAIVGEMFRKDISALGYEF